MLYNRKSELSRARRSFLYQVNVKKTIAIVLMGVFALLVAGCGGGDPTRIPTRVSEAPVATQTPWIIYIPVTVTPGPATATLEPSVTPNEPPTAEPTETRPPATPRPVQPTKVAPPPVAQPTAAAVAAESPTAPAPAASPTPGCGQQYQVTDLVDPADGNTFTVKAGSGQGHTIPFEWNPVVSYEIDPTIGYRVIVKAPANSTALYISHNDYLKMGKATLNQQAMYGLTLGDDVTVTWYVEVIKAGEFDPTDLLKPPLGDVIVCGPPSPARNIYLHVI